MPSEYITHAERLGVPPWLRGAGVVVLGASLIGNLGVITYSMWSDSRPAATIGLVGLWVLGIVGVGILVRLWKATVRRSSTMAGSGNGPRLSN